LLLPANTETPPTRAGSVLGRETREVVSSQEDLEGDLIQVVRHGSFGRGGRGDASRATREARTLGLQKLEVLADHAQLAALLTRLLVFPAVELEATVDEEGRAFAEVELLQELGLLAPESDVHIGDFLALFSAGGGVATVDGETQVCQSRVAGLADFGFAGEVAHQGDFVVTSHIIRFFL